jgi:hypothetical protein
MTKRLKRSAEVIETTVKDFYAAGFDTLAKRCDKYINVCRGCGEINVLSTFEYHMFYVLYQFVTQLKGNCVEYQLSVMKTHFSMKFTQLHLFETLMNNEFLRA